MDSGSEDGEEKEQETNTAVELDATPPLQIILLVPTSSPLSSSTPSSSISGTPELSNLSSMLTTTAPLAPETVMIPEAPISESVVMATRPLTTTRSSLEEITEVESTPISPSRVHTTPAIPFDENVTVVTTALVALTIPRSEAESARIPFSLPSSNSSSLDILVSKTVTIATSVHAPASLLLTLPVVEFSLMSEVELNTFEAQLISLFDLPTPCLASNEADPLMLADSVLEIIEHSIVADSTILPQVDLGTCLELMRTFSRIPFEMLQRPIFKNGFIKYCQLLQQSNVVFKDSLYQAVATLDFHVNIYQAARTAKSELLNNKNFISQAHFEISALKEQHTITSQLQTLLLRKKAELEKELAAVNLALE